MERDSLQDEEPRPSLLLLFPPADLPATCASFLLAAIPLFAVSLLFQTNENIHAYLDRAGEQVVFRVLLKRDVGPDEAGQLARALAGSADFTWAPMPLRPLRLLEWPERIAATVPERDPHAPPERFRWRRADHDVRFAEGPERIAPEWWAREGVTKTRDYWRVEDATGRRFWICRYGLPRPGDASEWFLHGLFA